MKAFAKFDGSTRFPSDFRLVHPDPTFISPQKQQQRTPLTLDYAAAGGAVHRDDPKAARLI